ncbi:hypothetical protein Ddye_023377 [Dipteronia dyeriana]|uniref:La-related protein 6B n=1 Tax=Dipteronia dyeriana TaxID=168575 RepID=A0AAD9TTT6_9ROSI|nr:hypothetical protein Ddye_023377 [Dipteronia dyeriana]
MDQQASVETLDSSNNSDDQSQSLSRNSSFNSRLNAQAPEFVPTRSSTSSSSSSSTQTSKQQQQQLQPPPRLMMPPPPPAAMMHPHHVYSPHHTPPTPPFHVPMQNHVIPVHHHQIHHQHHAPVQNYNHRNHNHNNHRHHHNNHHHHEDHQEVSVSVPVKDHHKDKKDHHHGGGLSDESTQKILNQVEYYFSDLNLATTDHLMRFIHKDPDGYVPISVVASFKKIKAVISSNSQLAGILRNSSKLLVSEDGKKVKRQYPLTESDMEELQSRIVVAENLPEDHCHQNLMKIFSAVGSVKSIRTCLPQTSGGGASSASRSTKVDGMLFSNKLHAFVEYESVELAEKAIGELNDERDWRSGLRVRLMLRRGPKTAQARGKKGHDDEWHYDEEDTSTSEQQLNEKQWEDPSQQYDSPAHEHMGEEHIIDKEGGGQRKGRNRGRGKGRGWGDRGQHYHNHRGNNVGMPPSNNAIGNEQPTVGKQPPGPRMPDGTRGFAMGRGKPVAVNVV